MTLAAGTRLDTFEIVAPLGAGGMGEVYRARDTTLKREVAIKVLPAYVSQDPERLRRFEQEAQAAAALNHPNILAIHRFGTFDSAPYMVSELLDGSTLGQQLTRGPLPVRKAIDYGTQIASGLAAAHEKGIVHRDLKPDNIYVTKDGRVKILDFGLAKLTEAKAPPADGPTVTAHQRTEPGMVLGTVGYMSPEQVRGRAADHRTDTFAFGAILYEMLTGKRAFRKPTSTETMTAILNEEPAGISQIAPDTPPALLRIMHRCLEKNPEQRFQSASDLAFALEALSDSGTSSVVAINEGSRSRWVLVGATTAVVALAAALIAWWRIPPAVPVVESVTQLTDDGEAKHYSQLVADGPRVYFTEGLSGSSKIAQVSVTGGHTAVVDAGLVSPEVAGLAPDDSALLAVVGPDFEHRQAVWSIPLPAGEPRHLGSEAVTAATYFPDGRLLLVKEKDLYVADKDGSNPHKLLSVAGDMWDPSVSPDGKHIVFAVSVGDRCALGEIAADGTGLRTVVNTAPDECLGAPVWSSDGTHIIYFLNHGVASSDLWALPMQAGLFHKAREPVRLTNGPLAYSGPCPSRDGKQIFAIGTKRRGELVRYDMKSQQLVPFLPGISAIAPTFSRDGQWVAYASYPDHTLWRSRSDGTDRRQLTYPPIQVRFPSISPDGTKAAFSSPQGETYVVSMDGGQAKRIVEKNSAGASWSPDGNRLIMTSWSPEGNAEGHGYSLQIFDLTTQKMSIVPSSQGLFAGPWATQDLFVALNASQTKLLTFDVKSQEWSDLVTGHFTSTAVSSDRKYLYYMFAGVDPTVHRIRFSDRQVETVASLKDLRRVMDPVQGEADLNLAPDGSLVLTRDIGTQEIYALSVRWP